MQTMRYTAARCLLLAVPLLLEAKKKPKLPTQPDVESGCIAVRNIRSTRFGFTTGAGLDAVAENNCNRTADIFISVAYYDVAGIQFGQDIKQLTVAAGTKAEVSFGPKGDNSIHRLDKAMVVKVNAY